MAKKLKITQIHSASRRQENQGVTVRALGITKVNHSVVHNDTPQIRGMINKVRHLVRVEEIEE
jgi:large subunit ribosomal protein L30